MATEVFTGEWMLNEPRWGCCGVKRRGCKPIGMRTVFSTDKEWMTVGKEGVKKQGLGLILLQMENH